MVYQPSQPVPTKLARLKKIAKDSIRRYWFRTLLAFCCIAIFGSITFAIVSAFTHRSVNGFIEPVADVPDDSQEESNPRPTTPAFIDLQPTINAWTLTLPKNIEVGLMIYDLDNNRVAAEYNSNEIFNVASIYKLFFAYDGYLQIANGTANSEDFFINAHDDLHSGTLTLGDCLDLILRESYNVCADPMYDDPVRFARVEDFITELGLKNTTAAGLYSSANDVAEILKLYYSHPDFSAETWAKIQDSMLNQPETTYDWRIGLPAGFSDEALVYNKVGWNWTYNYYISYTDAAIVEFPSQNRHYIVVVSAENLPDTTPIVQLGQEIETIITSTF